MWWTLIVSLVIFWWIADSFLVGVRRSLFLDTEPVSSVDCDYALGFRFLYEVLRLRRQGTLPFYLLNRFIKHKRDTILVGYMLAPAFICIRDPANIKAILATQFREFNLGDRRPQFFPLLGDGIFTLDGAGWRHSRTMLAPQFSRDQVAQVRMLEPHVRVLSQHVDRAGSTAVDLQELFFRMTMDVATEFLFGELIGSLKDASVGYTHRLTVPGHSRFAPAFNRAQEGLTTRLMLQNLYWVYNPLGFQQANAECHQLVDYYVDRVLAMSPAQLSQALLGGYVFLVELVKQTRDRQVLRDQALNILLAGRDTTAGLLLFVFYALAKHPRVHLKLRNEVVRAFGTGDDLSTITFELLKRCEYLKAVLNETLRMYPSVPNNIRTAACDTTLPRGGGPRGDKPVFVPKGQEIIYNVFCMHRNPAIYGKDAHEFRPERWFEPTTSGIGWAYLPFNGGPRICLGQQFALTEASYVVVRLLQMYESIVDYNDDRGRLATTLTMSLMDGCRVGLVNPVNS